MIGPGILAHRIGAKFEFYLISNQIQLNHSYRHELSMVDHFLVAGQVNGNLSSMKSIECLIKID